MTALAELLRLMQARDDARKAWVHWRPDDDKSREEVEVDLACTDFNLRDFIDKTTAAEVGAPTAWWDVSMDDMCTDRDEMIEHYREGAINEYCGFVQGLPFFATWFSTGDGIDVLTAPTREELEKLIREAGDARQSDE